MASHDSLSWLKPLGEREPGNGRVSVYCYVCGVSTENAEAHLVCGERRNCGSCAHWRPLGAAGNLGACRNRGLQRYGNQHHCLHWMRQPVRDDCGIPAFES